jgi:molybdopterin/thiamine biosynthesis adenylyltransferase
MQAQTQQSNTDTRFLRNKDLIPQEKLDDVTVIGLGGIGSTVVSLLAIMGFDSILGYDDDILEEHNLSTCIYPHKYIGKSKAFAAQKLMEEYSCLSVGICEERRWTYRDGVFKNMIICPDNMEVRRDVYDKWVNQRDRGFLIDLRMDALAMEIIVVTKEHDFFDETWLPSAEIEDAPCTMKHTIFTSSIVAGFGVNQVFNVLANKPYYAYTWIGLMPFTRKTEHLIKQRGTNDSSNS